MQAILKSLVTGSVEKVHIALHNAGRGTGSTGNRQYLLNRELILTLGSRWTKATKMTTGKNHCTCHKV